MNRAIVSSLTRSHCLLAVRRGMINGHRSTLYPPFGYVFQPHGERGQPQSSVPILYANQTTFDKLNAKNGGSTATTSHEGKPVFFPPFFSHRCGWSCFTGLRTSTWAVCLSGCQTMTPLVQQCPGNVAECCAKFFPSRLCAKFNLRHGFCTVLR